MGSSIRLKRFCAILARSRWNANWIHYCSLPYAHTGLFPWPFLLPVVRMTDHSTRREYRMCVFVPFYSCPARRRKRQTSLIAFLAYTFLTLALALMMLYHFALQWTSKVNRCIFEDNFSLIGPALALQQSSSHHPGLLCQTKSWSTWSSGWSSRMKTTFVAKFLSQTSKSIPIRATCHLLRPQGIFTW